jgi:lipopolysaccharide transport system permease protein
MDSRRNMEVDAGSMRRSVPLITLRPTRGWISLDLRELHRYRDLIAFFAWRDIKVRYRQTFLGASWALIQPLLTMSIMAVVFGRLAGVPSDGIPYPLFCFTGVVLWSFFSQAITNSSASVVGNAQLVQKVYFPRLAITIGATLAGLLDFSLSFALLLLIMAAYGFYPRIEVVLCVPILLATWALALGVGSGLAALTVRFRDFRHLVPFLVQLGLFATPVIYPISLIPAAWQPLAGLNPLAGFVESFRWALLGTGREPWPIFSISLLTTTILVPASLMLFRRMERSFADVI